MRYLLLITLLLLNSACTMHSATESQVDSRRITRKDPRPAAVVPPPARQTEAPAPSAKMQSPSNSGAATLLQQAAMARSHGDLRRAQSLAERAQSLDPRSGYSYLELARIYQMRGDHGRARQMALRGLNYAGDDQELHSALTAISQQ